MMASRSVCVVFRRSSGPRKLRFREQFMEGVAQGMNAELKAATDFSRFVQEERDLMTRRAGNKFLTTHIGGAFAEETMYALHTASYVAQRVPTLCLGPSNVIERCLRWRHL